ncbi:MAG: hypothetical protein RJA56_1861 [Pseudomonadota bacterium]
MLKQAPWWALGLVFLAAPWFMLSGASLGLLAQIGIAATVLMSYHLLLGQGGLLSFGHAVYVGAGAYAVVHAMNWGISGAWAVALVPLLGGLVAGALAVFMGWVSTRHAAMPFAMITLGVGELVWALSHMVPGFFGGEGGFGLDRAAGAQVGAWSWGPVQHLAALVAVYTVVCVGLMVAWTRTPMGRLLNAVRDNPLRAASVGVNPHRIRHAAFVVSATFAGVGRAVVRTGQPRGVQHAPIRRLPPVCLHWRRHRARRSPARRRAHGRGAGGGVVLDARLAFVFGGLVCGLAAR